MDQVARLIHILGVVLWIGGTVTALWAAASAPASKEGREAALSAARRAMMAIAGPGILLAWLGGLTLLLSHWSDVYARAGWMHGKLTVGIVVSALHGIATARMRKAATGERDASAGLFAGFAIAVLLLGLVAIALVVLRP